MRVKEEGLKQIRELAANTWTDHNLHDPSITILEAFCYALTDLGYRTNLNIKDLLAGSAEVGWENQAIFPAESILPNAALTISDYRKLLIDQEDVANVWVVKTTDQEQDIIFDPSENKLVYQSQNPKSQDIELKGLYKVQLEFEKDKFEEQDIRRELSFTISGISYEFDYYILLPHWDEVSSFWDQEQFWSKAEILIGPLNQIDGNNPERGYNTSLNISLPKNIAINLPLKIKVPGLEVSGATEDFWPELEQRLQKYLEKLPWQRALEPFNQSIAEKKFVVENSWQVLQANRNLCTDFRSVEKVPLREAGIEAQLVIEPNQPGEKILSEIFYQIDRYLAPPLKFYSLSELMERGYSPDEIFNGPLLKYGFPDPEEFSAWKERQQIYTSDLVRIIMEVEGVVGVNNVSYQYYLDHDRIARDSVEVGRTKPRFSARKSSIQVEGYSVNWDEVNRLYEEKKSSSFKKISRPWQLEIPEGTHLELEEYFSSQDEFPSIYGIGSSGLRDSEAPDRKAQAKQLKAYLIFFEQIIANHLAQLTNLKTLFSIKPSVDRTYFFQPLNNVPDVSEIIQGMNGDGANSYSNRLEQINEDVETYISRRHQFLNHLLSRFSEDMSSYTQLMLNLDKNYHTKETILDKIDFLHDYPGLNGRRGLGFNYRLRNNDNYPKIWDNLNLSGLEKRIYARLGLNNHSHREMFSQKRIEDHFEVYDEKDNDNIEEFRFRLLTESNEILLSSSTRYYHKSDLFEEVRSVISFGRYSYNYRCECAEDGRFYFNLLDDQNEIIARRIEYFEEAETVRREIDLTARFLRENFASERVHLVEHILLRPKVNETLTSKQVKLQRSYFHQYDIPLGLQGSAPAITGSYLEEHFLVYKTALDVEAAPDFVYGFEIYDENGTCIMKGLDQYSSAYHLIHDLRQVAKFSSDKRRYHLIKGAGGRFGFYLVDYRGKRLAKQSILFQTDQKREQEILRIVNSFTHYAEQDVLAKDELLSIVDQKGNLTYANNDPYSNRISVILPYESDRFRYQPFRDYAQQVVAEETPAHIIPEICFAYEDDFNRFENAYRKWVLIKSKNEPDDPDQKEQYFFEWNATHSRLIQTLEAIRANHGIGNADVEDNDQWMQIIDEPDEVIKIKDFIVSEPFEQHWGVGEMTVGKEFTIEQPCQTLTGIGRMRVGYDFIITDPLFKNRGIGYMTLGRNFLVI